MERPAKRCRVCGELKSLDDFSYAPRGIASRSSYCKPCHNARGRESRDRLYGGGREYHLRARYGIGQAEVDRMLVAQRGRCAGCGKPNPEHVDHDHATNEVRGLLCFNCNQALGNVRDRAQVLESLADYLAVAGYRRVPKRAYLPPVDVVIEYVGPSHPGALDELPVL